MTHEEAVIALAAATSWRKASYSQTTQNGCVEVAAVPGYVGVRDSKLGAASPILAFTPAEWDAFTRGVVAGEFASDAEEAG